MAANRALEGNFSRGHTIPIPPKKEILHLLEIILKNNIFTFNNRIYRQKIGVPMGGAASGELADLRMFEILENILQRFRHKNKILFCSRYRDDGFLLYN